MIFKGNWYDPAGIPFVRTSHRQSVYATGGTAANTRAKRRPSPERDAFVVAATNLGKAWLDDLTEPDRVLWDNCANQARNRANQVWFPYMLGWLAFNARNFHFMYYSALWHLVPHPAEPGAQIYNHFVHANIPAQHIEYTFDYNAAWADQTNAYVSIYQIDPENAAGVGDPNHTKFVAEEYTFDPGGGHKSGWANVWWPLVDYPALQTLWRVANGSVYTDNRVIATD